MGSCAAGGNVAGVTAVEGALFEELNHLLRILDGQQSQDKFIDEREDGGIGPDAERQRQHGRDGKHRGLTKLADDIAGVLQQSFDEWKSATITKLFFHLADSSKLTLGGVAGFYRRHALLYETICEQGDVIFYFAVKFRFQSVAAEEGLQPGEKGSQHGVTSVERVAEPGR